MVVRRLNSVRPEGSLAVVRSFWRPVDTEATTRESMLDLDVYECASREAAHDFLLQLLGRVEAPLARAANTVGVGDVAFTTPGGTAIFFARGNLVCVLRNAGRQSTAVRRPARALDQHVTARPNTTRGVAAPKLRRLRAPSAAPEMYAAVLLEVEVEPPPEQQAMVKIFSRAGEVALVDGTPTYRASSAAEDELEVYAVASGGAAARRTLPIRAAR